MASAIRNPTHADARPDPICLSTPGPTFRTEFKHCEKSCSRRDLNRGPRELATHGTLPPCHDGYFDFISHSARQTVGKHRKRTKKKKKHRLNFFPDCNQACNHSLDRFCPVPNDFVRGKFSFCFSVSSFFF